MLLGFKRRFAPFVEEGSKTHTIRAKRKPSKLGHAVRSPRAGEMCHCYVDPRQKTMRLLGRWKCVRVEPILIYVRGDGTLAIWINNVELDWKEVNELAWREGFRSRDRKHASEEMRDFWMETHGDPDLTEGWEGDLIHWEYVKPRLTREELKDITARLPI